MELKDLNEERRQQIISAATKEFAEKGYEQASTNTICKEAGVSKGLLFHYFENKKGLYLCVLDNCMMKYQKTIDRLLPKFSKDIVERIFQLIEMKIKIFAEDPISYSIVINAFIDRPKDIEPEIKARENRIYEQYLPLLHSNLDFSDFKPEVNPQKALELVTLVTDGLSEKYIKQYKQTKDTNVFDFDLISNELKVYMGMIKKGIYKTESVNKDANEMEQEADKAR